MSYNKRVESFRDEEYPMMRGKVYLDHGGTTIYAKSLIEKISKKMISNLYGNPHSASDPAHLSGSEVDRIREEALRFFGADPEHFDLIFTANATAAIKLVEEGLRDLAQASSPSGTFWYGYHKDAHTSLVGVRELTFGAHHCFKSDDEVEQWLNGSLPSSVLHTASSGTLGLFAYPGQSNMTGRRLPLAWSGKLRRSALPTLQDTYSLLDAAALATTCQLDFSDPEAAPDFTSLSFYKIFGFPDLGALIVRRKSGHILSWRKYFGGGTVNMLTVYHEPMVHRKDETLHEALEDGTLPFHNIIALGCAIEIHKKLFTSMNSISKHTSFLIQRLYSGLNQLNHGNGNPVCTIYNESSSFSHYSNPKLQGATLAFNVRNFDGTYIGNTTVESLANERKIFLRSGGLCNPGGIASYLKVEPWQFKRAYSSGFRCGGDDEKLQIIHGKPTGVVRTSLGAMSTIEDVDKFLDFIREAFADTGTYQLLKHDSHEGQVISCSPYSTINSNSRTVSQRSQVNSSSDSCVSFQPIPPIAVSPIINIPHPQKPGEYSPQSMTDLTKSSNNYCYVNSNGSLPSSLGNESKKVKDTSMLKFRLLKQRPKVSMRFWKDS
ncbi:pyridoxal phosphate-dependent transferase [Tricladium varicosporioides]|nr:pyridoxal phosphate-dependent transferase [Hymenoscyphus varicosporioides]